MKKIWVAAVFALAATPAVACNSELLTVQDWKAAENAANKFFPVDLSAVVKYDGQKAYRMIHAGVMFADALGRSVGQVNLDEDQHVSPGDTVTVDGHVDASDRLLKINRDDIVIRTCVWSIVYDNGTKEEF